MKWNVITDNWHFFLFGQYPDGPLGGLSLAIILAVLGIFFAFWLGLFIGLARLDKSPWIRYPAIVYVEVIRGTPLLMLVFWFYFLAPVVLGHTLPEVHSTLIAIVVFTAAYIAEIIRAGVTSLPKGQMEAARSTGLTRGQAMRYVILPQALFNMTPSFVNQFVSLTKDTSLGSIIGVIELTRAAQIVNNRTISYPFQIFVFIGILYFIVCFGLTTLSRRIEKKIARYQARDR